MKLTITYIDDKSKSAEVSKFRNGDKHLLRGNRTGALVWVIIAWYSRQEKRLRLNNSAPKNKDVLDGIHDFVEGLIGQIVGHKARMGEQMRFEMVPALEAWEVYERLLKHPVLEDIRFEYDSKAFVMTISPADLRSGMNHVVFAFQRWLSSCLQSRMDELWPIEWFPRCELDINGSSVIGFQDKDYELSILEPHIAVVNLRRAFTTVMPNVVVDIIVEELRDPGNRNKPYWNLNGPDKVARARAEQWFTAGNGEITTCVIARIKLLRKPKDNQEPVTDERGVLLQTEDQRLLQMVDPSSVISVWKKDEKNGVYIRVSQTVDNCLEFRPPIESAWGCHTGIRERGIDHNKNVFRMLSIFDFYDPYPIPTEIAKSPHDDELRNKRRLLFAVRHHQNRQWLRSHFFGAVFDERDDHANIERFHWGLPDDIINIHESLHRPLPPLWTFPIIEVDDDELDALHKAAIIHQRDPETYRRPEKGEGSKPFGHNTQTRLLHNRKALLEHEKKMLTEDEERHDKWMRERMATLWHDYRRTRYETKKKTATKRAHRALLRRNSV